MLPQLAFRLFGVPQITLDGQPLTGFVSNKAQALLIYLAVTGRAISREELATLFWGDMRADSARANLNKALSNLRKLVGDHLDAEARQPVRLRLDHCWVDVSEFANKLGRHPPQTDVPQLQAAIALYQADFLAGFVVHDAADFEEWVREEGDRLRQLMLNALDALAKHYAASGDLAQAIVYTQRQLTLESGREEIHWQLITLYFRNGQISTAQKHYKDWRQALANDLRGLPANEVTAFLQGIDDKFQAMFRRATQSHLAAPEEAQRSQRAQPAPRNTGNDHPIADLTPAQRLAALPLETIPAPAPLPPHSLMPLAKNPLFVGRERDLRMLAAALKAGGVAAVSQVETAAATGLGGIGKTQLACEFVHRYGQFFAGGVFWLSFGDAEAIPAEVAACGGAGGLELLPDFGQRPLGDQVRLVQAAWQAPIPRLLVFDNCENPALLARWRPVSGGCRVLVTSRRGDWEPALGVHPLALDVLSRAESLTLLRKHRPDIDEAILDAIAEEVGDLPLALHLAGSYLHRYRRVVEPIDYLAQLRDPNLLQHPSFQGSGISPTGHIQHVGRTFALSYDRLDPADASDALALKLLVRAAHFAPGEPIWYKLLVKTLGLDPTDQAAKLQVDQGFARLIALGLILLERDDILRMHRLVAAFVRQVAQAEVEATQKAVEAVVYEETAAVNRAGYPLPLLAWQAHLRAVVNIEQVREDESSAALCEELGQHLQQIGDYPGAMPYCEKALVIRRKILGEEHPATAQSLSHMGHLLQTQGKLAAAKPYFERALAIREKILGEEHADTAESLNDMGRWLFDQGEWAAACPYFERAFHIGRKVRGEDDALTAEYASNLGVSLQNRGDLNGALLYLQHALAINEKVLGAEHPRTALSLNNVGVLFFTMGRWAEAKSHYERALAIRRQMLGDAHPSTGQTLNNLGSLAREQGAWEEAQRYLEQALAVYERALGQTHARVAYCLNNLGLLLQAQGKLPEAHRHLARALTIRQAALGNRHSLTALSLHNLGMVLLAQGEPAKARACLAEALAIRCAVLGEDDPLTIETRSRLEQLA